MNKGGRPQTHGFAKRGMKRPKEYNSWMHMIGRCTNPNHTRYPAYGAKGIKVCERWRKFVNFFKDMGKPPTKKHTLDRYPNKKGNYEPGNVRWATIEQQNWNRTDNRLEEYNGEIKPVAQWIKELKLTPSRIYNRLSSGWTFAEAVEFKKMKGWKKYRKMP